MPTDPKPSHCKLLLWPKQGYFTVVLYRSKHVGEDEGSLQRRRTV